MTTGERIREARKNKGLSQDGLAKAAGMTQAQISYIERNGDRKLRKDTIERLSVALGVDLTSVISAAAEEEELDRVNKRLCRNIRLHRKMRGLTQTQLAKLVGVRSTVIREIEREHINPSDSVLAKIMDVLSLNRKQLDEDLPKVDPVFDDYQLMLIVRAIRTRISQAIEQEAVCLANGMEVDKSEVLRVWEEHKDD